MHVTSNFSAAIVGRSKPEHIFVRAFPLTGTSVFADDISYNPTLLVYAAGSVVFFSRRLSGKIL
jgi:hypothetical protein